ncbi:MAG: head GIN domain-containing protein, partial [Ginsengibacter sp.]
KFVTFICRIRYKENLFMKPFFIIMFIVICSSVFAQQTIINDKNAEVRSVITFSGIKVSGGIDVFLSQADSYSLAVSADEEKYRDNIKTEVKNGVLVISYGNDHFGWSSGDKKLRAYVSFKSLESLEASGACDLSIAGTLNANSMLIKLSGASDIKGPVKITDLTLNLSGASTVKINGSAENLNITASGASDVKNYDFVIENCVAKLSGASDVRITVRNSISGSASGASTLHYEGNPERKDVATSGASSISQKKN